MKPRRDRQAGATCSAIRAAYSCLGSAISACRRRAMGSFSGHRRCSSCCSASRLSPAQASYLFIFVFRPRRRRSRLCRRRLRVRQRSAAADPAVRPVLRNKAIKPLLAAAQARHPARAAHNPKPIDAHYQAIRVAMNGVFHELGLAA
jgi:hypothetical protein